MLKHCGKLIVLFLFVLFSAACDKDESTDSEVYDLNTIYPTFTGAVYSYKQTNYVDSVMVSVSELRVSYLEEVEFQGMAALKFSTEEREWDNESAEWSDPVYEYLSISYDSLFITTNSIWKEDASLCGITFSLPGDTLRTANSGNWIFVADNAEIATEFATYTDCIYTKFDGREDSNRPFPDEDYYYKAGIGLIFSVNFSRSRAHENMTIKELVSYTFPE